MNFKNHYAIIQMKVGIILGNIIEFKNTNFGYNGTNTFHEFNMEIEEGDVVSLIGPSGSGKTTLLKMLCHKLPNLSLNYCGIPFPSCDISELKHNVVVVFDSNITTTTLKSEMTKYLKKLDFSSEEIESRYDEFKTYFKLKDIEDKEITKLPSQDEYLIKILRYLIIKPKFIAIDCLLTNLRHEDKENIINYIRENGMTLLNVTTDLSETLFGNKIFVLENFVLILEGSTLTVLKTDTLLKRLGMKLPLPIELSIDLCNYEILKKIYTSNEKLVNALWK